MLANTTARHASNNNMTAIPKIAPIDLKFTGTQTARPSDNFNPK